MFCTCQWLKRHLPSITEELSSIRKIKKQINNDMRCEHRFTDVQCDTCICKSPITSLLASKFHYRIPSESWSLYLLYSWATSAGLLSLVFVIPQIQRDLSILGQRKDRGTKRVSTGHFCSTGRLFEVHSNLEDLELAFRLEQFSHISVLLHFVDIHPIIDIRSNDALVSVILEISGFAFRCVVSSQQKASFPGNTCPFLWNGWSKHNIPFPWRKI